MSFEDLDRFLNKTETQPQDPIEPAAYEELAAQREDIDAMVSQREIEESFNDTRQDNFMLGGLLKESLQRPQVSANTPLVESSNKRDFEKIMFAAGYSNRLTRSAMNITGLSATAERFGDIRKSQGFWVAFADIANTITSIPKGQVPTSTLADITGKASEEIKKVPAVLTDVDTPASELSGIGGAMTDLGAPPQMEWVYDMLGEMWVETKLIAGIKALAKTGTSKLAKAAYEGGEQIAKKGGVSRMLASVTDEEISAIAQARKAKKIGLLGTRPPQGQIDKAVNSTFDYIKETGEARLTKQQAIKTQRKKGAARLYDVQGEGYGKGYTQRLRKAGATKKAESSFVPLLEASEAAVDDFVTLQKTIDNYDFGGSKIYTTVNAQEALSKLYEFGELLTKGDVEHLRDIFGQDFANSLTKFTSKPKGVTQHVINAAEKTIKTLNSTSRTLMTTGELSFLLRQGNYRAWSRPSEAIRSFAVASRSLISPKYAAYWDEAMRAGKAGREALEDGLWLGKWDATDMLRREEDFMAGWLDKVPGVGKLKTGFERGYTTGLNQLRLDWYEEGLNVIKASGKGGDDALRAQWADYINNMTGRADLDAMIKNGFGSDADGIMRGMAETAKKVAFAPRFAVSKINKHKVAAEILFSTNTPSGLRAMMVQDTVVKWRRYERFAKYATDNGYEVETDPRSSDFLKFKRGDTRFDVLGGDAAIMVLAARIATGETKDTATGEVREAVAEKIAQQYLAGKLNPLASLAYDRWIAQETFEGGDINDPKVLAKAIGNRFWPLYDQDVKDKIFNGYEEEGLTLAESIENSVSTIVLGFVGAGVQTYPPSPTKEIELIYNDASQRLYAQDFAELTADRKKEVMLDVEFDHEDKIDELKGEAGMSPLSPGAAAKIQAKRNKSERQVKKGLGSNYKTFTDSMVSPGAFNVNVRGVKLNAEQQNKLNSTYVKEIKRLLAEYPEIKNMPVADPTRRQWLQDIIDDAKEEAVDILFDEEPVRYEK
jgi:hypothetical protein